MKIIDTQAMYGPLLNEGFTLDNLRFMKKFFDTQGNHTHDLKYFIVGTNPDLNPLMADVVKDNPDLLLGAYLILAPYASPPDSPFEYRETTPKQIEKLAKRSEIIGLKVPTSLLGLDIDDPALDPYYEIAGKAGIPVLNHCSSDDFEENTSDAKIRDRLERNPGVNVILAHNLGGLRQSELGYRKNFLRDYSNAFTNTTAMTGELRRLDKTTGLLAPSTHSDIHSAIMEYDLLASMADGQLNKKYLWGTDFPWLLDVKRALTLFEKLPEDAQHQFLENAKRVFPLEERLGINFG